MRGPTKSRVGRQDEKKELKEMSATGKDRKSKEDVTEKDSYFIFRKGEEKSQGI